MYRSYKIEGIVIKRVNFAEADKVLTIFTKKQGKLVVLAKGIRKIKSRRAPHLELFHHIIAYIAIGRNFDIVTEVQTIDSFSHLRADLNLLAHTFQVIEEIDRLCPEKEEHGNVFTLLLSTLKQLDGKETINSQKIVDNFTLQLLWESGYLPRDKVLSGENLNQFLKTVMERDLKSNSLLLKIR
jgi:DNA repair protein RecO (recombination protein O)